jgi:hypothetical protein
MTVQPPDDLRPAQVGLVLVGHPTLGQVAGTVVDLHRRGAVTVVGDALALGETAELAGWERDLAEDLAGGVDLEKALGRFRTGLVADAVAHRWFQHLRHDHRTEAGEDLATRARVFRVGLRSHRDDPELLAYAVVLGLADPETDAATRYAAALVGSARDLPGWAHERIERTFTPIGSDSPNDVRIAAMWGWSP